MLDVEPNQPAITGYSVLHPAIASKHETCKESLQVHECISILYYKEEEKYEST